jgi:triacylglycerol lipase
MCARPIGRESDHQRWEISLMEISARNVLKSILALGLMALATLAQAQIKGPAPTNASIQADGPFAVSTQTVAGSGFGGGTVYSPNTAGQYALVAMCPGFTATQSSVAALGRRLATHGFVVVTINTNSSLDFPPSRGTQLLAALRTVSALTSGPVAGKIDPARLVVSGHSMGGGGALYASVSNPALRASVPLAPFSFDNSFNTSVPQLLIGGQNDSVAPPAIHSRAFYAAMPDATSKTYAEIAGAEHSFPTGSTPHQPSSKLHIAWIKRFADGDTRYEQFISQAGLNTELSAGRLSAVLRESMPF